MIFHYVALASIYSCKLFVLGKALILIDCNLGCTFIELISRVFYTVNTSISRSMAQFLPINSEKRRIEEFGSCIIRSDATSTLEDHKCNLLNKFGSELKEFEAKQYAEGDFPIYFIKMRLVRVNFDFVEGLLAINDYTKMGSYTTLHLSTIKEFIKYIASASSKIDANVENNGDEDRSPAKKQTDICDTSGATGREQNPQGSVKSDDSFAKVVKFDSHLEEEGNSAGVTSREGFVDENDLEKGNNCLNMQSVRRENEPYNETEDSFRDIGIFKPSGSNAIHKKVQLLKEKIGTILPKISKAQNPKNILEIIDMLQYMTFDETATLIEILTMRIQHETINDIPYDVLQWIFYMVVSQTESIWIKIFTWVFGLNSICHWADELLVQYLIYSANISVKYEQEFRTAFQSLECKSWIPAIFQLLVKVKDGWDDSALLTVATMLKSASFEDSRLEWLLGLDSSQLKALKEKYSSSKDFDLWEQGPGNEEQEASSRLNYEAVPSEKECLNQLLHKVNEKIKHLSPYTALDIIKQVFSCYWPSLETVQRNDESSLSNVNQCDAWKNMLEIIRGIIAETIGETFTKKWWTTCSKNFNSSIQTRDFIVNSLMLCVQSETKDAKLYAKILEKFDLPMGIIEIEALSEATDYTIRVIHFEKKKHERAPLVFKPTREHHQGENSRQVLVCLFGHNYSTMSHFSVPGQETDDSSKNNCLLNAMNKVTGMSLKRSDLAAAIVNCRAICAKISDGIHKQYMKDGYTGGVTRTSQQQEGLLEAFKKLECMVKTDISANRFDNTKYKEVRNDLRDQGEIISNRKTERVGNHELVALEYLNELIRRDTRGEASKTSRGKLYIKWSDLCMHFRVDIRYCVFLYKVSNAWTVQGHPRCLFTSSQMKDAKEVGNNTILHTGVGEKALNEVNDSPYHCAKKVLEYHLDAMGSKEEFKDKRRQNPQLFKNWYVEFYFVKFLSIIIKA